VKFIFFIFLYFFSNVAFSQNLNLTCSEKSVLKNIEFAGKNFSPKPLTATEDEKIKQEKIKLKSNLCKKNNTCFTSVDKVGLQPDQISSVTDILAYAAAQENNKDKSFSDTEKHIAHLEYYLEYCENLKSPKFSDKRITIVYKDDGFNRNKNGSYLKDDIESIIEKAIYEGVDPYLAVSVLLLENPPLPTEKSFGYKLLYGVLPIDAIAAYDQLGCIKKETIYNGIVIMAANGTPLSKVKVPGTIWSQKNIFPLKLDYMKKSGFETKESLLCSDETKFSSGHPPSFRIIRPEDTSTIKNQCCIKVETNRLADDQYNDVLGTIAMKFLKSTVQDCIGKSPAPYCIQKYNGLGCFNCTEQMNNQCLNGVVMADRPVYGHRALDLMAQSLMTNPELNKLILEHSNRLKKPVFSIFCSGETTISINPRKYLLEQKELLLNGDKKFFSYAAKTSAGIKLKVADTDDEKRIYLEKEQKRKIACEKHFKEK